MVFRVVSCFLIHAMRATFLGLPASTKRLYIGFNLGWHWIADVMEVNRTVRTRCLPSQMYRLPWKMPLSRFIGATPTSAAISLLFNFPSSGISLISV